MGKQRTLRSRLVAWMIRASVPLLNRLRRPQPFPHTLDELRALPPHTLGFETAAFLDQRRFGFLPQYETHDIIHTLLGYDTTTTGELSLQAFMTGNQSASVAGRVLLVLGVALLPELWGQLRRDFHRGRHAEQVSALDFHEAVNRSRSEVQMKLGLSA